MCGRYFFSEETYDDVVRDFWLTRETVPELHFGEISPGMSPLTLVRGPEGASLLPMFWGLKTCHPGYIINARSESVLDRECFYRCLRKNRCVIPASHFFEWDRSKVKTGFWRKDGTPIYLAGFYDGASGIDRFVILTTGANTSMAPIHDRMPLMLEREDVVDWLTKDCRVEALLRREMPALVNDRKYEQMSLFEQA